MPVIAQPACDGEAVFSAQIYIQQNHVGRVRTQIRTQLYFAARLKYLQTLSAKVGGNEFPNIFVIIND